MGPRAQPDVFDAARSRAGSRQATGRGALPPLCRPAGWAALWRRMGNLSVLNRGSGPHPA